MCTILYNSSLTISLNPKPYRVSLSFVDDEVQFETKIPSHGALPHNSIVLEHLVAPDTLVMADGNAGAVNKTYPCATTEAAHLQKEHHFHRKPCLEFHQASI